MATNILDAFNVDVWSNLVIQKLYQTNVASAVMANTDYEGDVRKAGSTVYVRTYGRVSWGSYTKGKPISYQELGSVKEPMVVNDAQYFAFALDDLDRVQSDLPLEEPYTREAVVSLNELIDTKLFSYYIKANAANVIGTAGAPITLDGTNNTIWAQMVEAEKRLNQLNVPQEGRWMIIGTDAKAWMAKDSNILKAAQPIAETLLRTGRPNMTTTTAPGYVGTLNNFDIYMSTNLPQPASGVTANIYGQGKPVSYASKFQELETLRLQNTFANAVRGLLLHDAEVFGEYAKRLGVLYTN